MEGRRDASTVARMIWGPAVRADASDEKDLVPLPHA